MPQIKIEDINLFKVVFKQISIPVCLYGIPDFKILLANDAMLAIWGRGEELIGKPYSDELFKEQNLKIEDILKEVLNSGKSREAKEIPFNTYDKDGRKQKRYFNICFEPLKRENGFVYGIMKTAHEITEAVQERHNLELIKERNLLTLEASGIGTFDSDLLTGKIWLDSISSRFVGFILNSDARKTESNIKKYVHPADQELMKAKLADTFDPGKKNVLNVKFRILNTETQSYFWVHGIGKAYFNSVNMPYRFSGTVQDITEDVNVTNEKKKMLSLVDNTSQYMGISDMNGNMIYLNKFGRNFIGIDPYEEISKYHIKDFYTPEHYKEANRQIQPSIISDKNWTGTIYLKHQKTEEILPCKADFILIRDSLTNEPIARGVTIQDLRSELSYIRNLAESEDRFRRLIQQSPVAICIFKGEHNYLEIANQKMMELIGAGFTTVGKTVLDIKCEDLRASILSGIENVNEKETPHFVYDKEVFNPFNNQKTYFNLVFSPLLDASDKLNGVVVIANDVTAQVKSKQDLERSEKHFRSLMLDAPIATALYRGRDLVIDVANEQMLKIWGKSEKVIGKKLHIAVPELEGQPFLQLLDEVYTSGEVYHTEKQEAIMERNGKMETSWYNFTYKPLFNEKGEVYAILNMAVDISTQVQLQNQKDEFLGIASHELKTPVTTIKAYAQMLEDMLRKAGDINKANLMLKMDKQVNRLTSLITDLLDVTKITSGQISFNRETFDFDSMVEEVVETIQETTEKHEITFNKGNVGGLYADKNRLEQVLTNLLINAIKYSPGNYKILVQTQKDGNKDIVLSVKDFGIGINKINQERIFEQFYRISDENQYTFPGLGLGLYISSEIVKRENGEIWLESEEKKGSTFYVRLPLNKTELKQIKE